VGFKSRTPSEQALRILHDLRWHFRVSSVGRCKEVAEGQLVMPGSREKMVGGIGIEPMTPPV
jgi:hypothetical protein